MLVKTYGSAVYGVEALTITVEVNVTSGQKFYMVGLPDNAVKESEQRIESTLKSIGYFMPRTKVIINLAPADIKKTGTAFDLPIALGIMGASEQLPNAERLSEYVIMGELSLDGNV
ncbi:MAG: magnesium chelatase, partial [Bacteroidetes bacterium]|nr:magnesium chelatase [Bacteroidota bacterium]